jgi:hypothetical protein
MTTLTSREELALRQIRQALAHLRGEGCEDDYERISLARSTLSFLAEWLDMTREN